MNGLDDSRKPQYPERTHIDTGRTQNATQKGPSLYSNPDYSLLLVETST